MVNALILGGHGKVAQCLARQLVRSGSKVHSLIRNSAQSDAIKALGAEPVVQSIEDSTVDQLAQTILGCGPPDVVVWSAGAGGGNPERTKTVDHLGAVKVFDACAEAGVKRFIIVSAIDLRDRTKPAPEWYDEDDRKRSDRVWDAIKAYMVAKYAADKDLVINNLRRKLHYTIVRPGSLSNDPGKGTVAAGKVHLGNAISREDVASVITAVINEPKTIGMAFDVVGGDTDIKQAIQKVVEDKADTFEGRY